MTEKGFDLPEDMDSIEQPIEDEILEVEDDIEVDDSESDDSEVETKTVKVKQPYSPDEIKKILREGDFNRIDTSRLSEEGRAVMKAMQSGLTPKLQESADLKRELQELRTMLKEAAPKPQPKNLFEAFDQNPEETMEFVHNRIQMMIDQGADIREIEKVREIREQLRDRRSKKIEEQAKSTSQLQESVNALLRVVPDIETKQYDLREFAIEYMGMSPQELDYETSIQAKGMDAVKMISRINTAYDKLMAGKRAKSKLKAKAVKVEKPGGGFEKQETTLRDLKEKAKKTGNWKDVFLAMND